MAREMTSSLVEKAIDSVLPAITANLGDSPFTISVLMKVDGKGEGQRLWWCVIGCDVRNSYLSRADDDARRRMNGGTLSVGIASGISSGRKKGLHWLVSRALAKAQAAA